MLGNYLPSLTVVRSLHAAGHRVVAGDGGEFSTVGRSRACHELWRHPPVRQPEEFLSALTTLVDQRPDITTVLPLQERYVALLATVRDRLPAHLVVATPDPSTVSTCLDKNRMYEVARAAGVPFRPIVVATSLTELAGAAASTGYPAVVRPTSGATSPLPDNRKAVIARDRAELDQTFPVWPDGHVSLIVQRYVDGPRHNVYFAADRGRVLGRVQTKILRTDRSDGTGYATDGITVASDPVLVDACDAIVGRLAYTGIGCAQFLVPPDGEMSFLELNPRHGAAAAIATACGLDLALAAIDLASGQGWSPGRELSYPVGRRYAWTTGELYAVLTARSAHEISRAEMMRRLGLVAATAARAETHLTWSFRDPRPTRAVLARTMSTRRRSRARKQASAAVG